MIRIGICAPIEKINEVAGYGYEYIEGNLAQLAAMSDEEFETIAALVDAAPIKVEAYNCQLPGSIKITGPSVDAQVIHDYLDKAFARAKRLGGVVSVFGSGGSRNVPDGWPIDVAWRQITNYLRMAERHAADHGITIAIEPLRRAESNIINMVSEATALASIVQLPHIRALGDTYHMALGSEPLSALTLAGGMLAHVHTANPIGRVFPKPGDGEDYAMIFKALDAGGYEGRISVEGGCADFAAEAPVAFSTLDEARSKK